ncbi:MAG: glycoside hydrolase family 3 N-terminal domain-containing protein [Pedobacter sp.]|jgi:beta-glucosidase-like glycosyl hydrolase
MYKYLKHLFFILCMMAPLLGIAQSRGSFIEGIDKPNAWVDSVFKKLNKRERIAQIFMVRAHTDRGKAFEDSIARLIAKEKIGGLVFFQGGPARQAALTSRYQSISEVPLLIAMDAEWGLGMRLDSTISYPYQLTLGAIQNNELIYEMGKQIALDFKRIGMQVNFAPVADINNNPKNPVIGFRSFGDDKFKVADKVKAYMKGLQENDILVSVKHFPGHGDTDVDSHHDLPQLPFTRERLDSLELYPFKELVKSGASGIMVAHMNIPALDKTPNLPSTLSKPIVTGMLKNDLGFKGLIFSDAMEMKGVAKFYPNGEGDVLGIIAGLDIIELSTNSKRAVKLVRKAVQRKELSLEQLNSSIKKMLYAKYWAGLDQRRYVNPYNIVSDLNRPEARVLNQKLADAAVTVLNSDSWIRNIDYSKKTAILTLGSSEITSIQRSLKPLFSNSLNYILPKDISDAEIENVKKELQSYEQIIVNIHDLRRRPAPVLDYTNGLKLFIADLAKMNSLFNVFANPYALAGLPGIESAKTLILNYQNTEQAQSATFRTITGEVKASGKLPVTVNSAFKNGDGIVQ